MASSHAWRLGAVAAPEEERVAAAEETKRVHLLLDDAPAFRANAGPIATDLGTGFYGTTATVSSGLVLLCSTSRCTLRASDYSGFGLSVWFRVSTSFSFRYEFSSE